MVFILKMKFSIRILLNKLKKFRPRTNLFLYITTILTLNEKFEKADVRFGYAYNKHSNPIKL